MSTLPNRSLVKSILIAGALFAPLYAQAQSQNIDCTLLVGDALKAEVVPHVNVDPVWGIVRITSDQTYCREPIEVWGGRGLPWPVVLTPDAEAPKTLMKQRDAIIDPIEPEQPTPPLSPIPPIPAITPVTSSPPKQIPPVQPDVASPPIEPPSSPSFSANRLPSIISGREDIPETIQIEMGSPSVPKLADLVQSKMTLKTEEDPNNPPPELTSKENAIDYIYFVLWGAIACLGLGFMVVMYFTLYKPKPRVNTDDEPNADNEAV